jgi:hypothetical protein
LLLESTEKIKAKHFGQIQAVEKELQDAQKALALAQ